MRIASVVLIGLALAFGAQAGVVYTAVGTIADADNLANGGLDTYTFTFALPADFTTDPTFSAGTDDFSLMPTIEYTYDTASATGTQFLTGATATFWDVSEGGLLNISWDGDNDALNLYGPPLFTGSPSDPTLIIGTTFIATADDNPGLSGMMPGLGDITDVVLTDGVQTELTAGQVTVLTADLPEPGTFPLIAGGILLLMPGLRKLRKSR